ncbi:MAG: RluA family pseudouridine synthase [Rhodoferax sp.]
MKHIIEARIQSAAAQVKLLTVDERGDGMRLDNYLLRQLPGVPKTHVYRIIRSGEVRLNKARTSADARVQLGDQVRLPPMHMAGAAPERAAKKDAASRPAQPKAAAAPQAPALPLLWEDDYLLAVNKPAGVAVHGGSGVSFGVIEQLRMARPKAPFLELVHRLDRQTSGILLVAKRKRSLTHLQEQFRDRATGKVYLAAVAGLWPASKRVIDKPLHKSVVAEGTSAEERRVRVVSRDDPQGQHALTLVRVLAQAQPRDGLPQGASLLEVTIKTGRTHQIRVHLASEGHPILGDDKYGDFERNKALARGVPAQAPLLPRMFLHAWRLQCLHPVSAEPLQIQAELPPELAQFVRTVFTRPPAPGAGDTHPAPP